MTALRYRPADSRDIEALCELINIGNRYDNIPEVLSPAEVQEELDDAGDVTTDVLLAVRGVASAEEIVGYIRTMYLPSDVLWERCYLFGCVHPDHRGSGIGQTLMVWGTNRAAEQLASSANVLPKYIRVELDDRVESARRLFDRLGFRKVRVTEELLRPLIALPEYQEPDGVRIVEWPTDRDEEILTVKNAAFADHWGSTPTPANSWKSMVRGFGSFSQRSFVALDNADRVVAYALNHRTAADDAVLGRRDGWIHNLGTLPEWRRCGLASALIIRSLHSFVDAGLTHASIGVDSESLTGAHRLYRSLGFDVNRRHSTLEIDAS